MNVHITQGSIESAEADAIIVNLFEGVTSPGGATGAVDSALDGAISDLIAGGDFNGKKGEVAALYPRGVIPARRVLLVGLGKEEQFDLEAARQAAGNAIQQARKLNARTVATIVHGAGIGGLEIEAAAQATIEGSLLALYRFDKPQQATPDGNEVTDLTIVEFDEARIPAIEQGAAVAEAVCAGTVLARNLVNLPPNYCTPSYLAEIAQAIADEHGMDITIGDRAWAEARDMGAFLAVAKGAGDEPRFVVLEHRAGDEDLDTIVLVGKGITFDTGGISIKPTQNMWTMKGDMGGAAAVLGTMKTVGLLDLPLRVIGITPCTENKPDADAYRPSDVITASNGKTIEIISTDAEGRMVLADGLVYAGRYQPKAVVDLATLTGSCVVALGKGVAAGLFANDDGLGDRLQAAAGDVFERLWPLPLYDDYKESIKSDSADIKNSGGRMGGVGTSAAFLREFTDYPWAHLDIAGMALSENATAYIPKGGTGFGVRLLTRFLMEWNSD
jgi:leucyl aminopeptidase